MTPILSFQSSETDLQYMGGKAANLYHLCNNNVPVPPWFCVSSQLFSRYATNIESQIAKALSCIDYTNQQSVQQASASIKEAICSLELSSHDQTEITSSLTRLAAKRYAVRSSALGEDSSQDSFAGQLDTFLHVRAENVIAKIKECWASSFSPRSLTYMNTKGIEPLGGHIAVVVQAMVDSDSSGVLFMANPTGSLDEAVIVAGYGLGEGIVSDQVESDTYIFNNAKKKWHLCVHPKKTKIVCNPVTGHGTTRAPVQPSIQKREALSEPQRIALYELGVRISKTYGHFQDIEWALEGKKLYITQSRPITTIPQGEVSVFDNSNVVESYPGITKPLTYSHIRYSYELLFRNAVIRVGVPRNLVFNNHQVFRNLVGYLGGRIYYNLGNWYRMFGLIPGVKRHLGVWEEMLGIEQGLQHRQPAKTSFLGTAKCLVKALYHLVFLSPHSKKIKREFTRDCHAFRATNLEDLSNHELISKYQTFVSNMLFGWEITLFNDAYAFFFSGAVRSALKKYELSENLFGGLMAGEKHLESVLPVRSVVSLAEKARSNSNIGHWLSSQLEESTSEIDYTSLSGSKECQAFTQKLCNHLDLYGDRCLEELKLESLPFRDRPKALLELIYSYAQSTVTVGEMIAKEKGIRSQATSEVAKKLRFKPLSRLWFQGILTMAPAFHCL